jgi:hypothetical protein
VWEICGKITGTDKTDVTTLAINARSFGLLLNISGLL